MRSRTGVVVLLALIAPVSGCGLIADAPPDATPAEMAPALVAEAPEADGIMKVRLPVLNRDGFRRQAANLTMRIRNLTCDGLATGSGFALDRHTIVTNRHVVVGAERLEVDTSDGRLLDVRLAQVAVLGDIALVEVDQPLPVLADFVTGAASGMQIAAVGYPLGGPFTISRGRIVDRVSGARFDLDWEVLRVTAEVRPGNSGGPLFDAKGRVMGVVFATEIATGYGLAIPIETMNAFIAEGGLEGVPACGSE